MRPVFDPIFGAGRLNAFVLLNQDAQGQVSITYPTNGQRITGVIPIVGVVYGNYFSEFWLSYYEGIFGQAGEEITPLLPAR